MTEFSYAPVRAPPCEPHVVGLSSGAVATIHFICPDSAVPVGGIEKTYRHVEVLSRAGNAACIVHQQKSFRCGWLDSQVTVRYLTDCSFGAHDIVVVPEIAGQGLHEFPGDAKIVVYNQNAYLTFAGYPVDVNDEVCPYRSRRVLATIVVSDDSEQYLRHVFPGIRIYRLHHGVDAMLFRPRTKKPQICFMPRKNFQDAQQVLNILKFRGQLFGVSIVPIDGMNHGRVAEVMGESLIFLSFGHPEGCGLPALEAMASGCITIGYHGNGGREYLREPYAYPIEVGDIVGYARCVESVLTCWRKDPTCFHQMTQQAVEFIRHEASPEREEADIISIWNQIFAMR